MLGLQLDIDGVVERIEPAEELPMLGLQLDVDGVEPGFQRIELRFELRVHGHDRGVDGSDGVA